MTSSGLFVTGTDTSVGKTLFAAALTAALRRRGMRVAVMKPVETGCGVRLDCGRVAVDGMPGELDDQAVVALKNLSEIAGPPPITVSTKTPPESLAPADANFLIQAARHPAPLDLVNPYRFAPAIAPAVAAELAETKIDLSRILDCFAQLKRQADFVVVEGAGGLLVPWSPSQTIADLIAAFELPTVVVGRSALGTINHCLLTLQVLSARQLPCAGVVLNRLVKRPSPEEAANPHQIERLSGETVRGVMPYFTETEREDFDYLAQRCEVHVDIDGIIASS